MVADLLFLASGESYNWRDNYDKIHTRDLSSLATHLYFAGELVLRELSKRNVREGHGAPRPDDKGPDDKGPDDKELLEQTITKYSGETPFPESFERWLSSEFHVQSTRLGKVLKTFVQRGVIEPSEKPGKAGKADPRDSERPAIYRASKLEMCLVTLSSCMGPASAILLLYAIVSSKLKARSTWELSELIRYLWQTRNLTPLFFQEEAHMLIISSGPPVPIDPDFSSLSSGSQIFLALLVCFGGTLVPDLIFKRFLVRQFRWSPKGDRTIAELGWAKEEPGVKFTYQLIGILKDKNMSTCETQLLSRSWLKIEEPSDPMKKRYSVPDDIKNLIMTKWNVQICRYWHKIAFQLICHIFPRDAAWETSFHAHGELLVPCLDHVMNFFNGDLSDQMRLTLAESLTARARLGKRFFPDKALEDAENLLKSDLNTPKSMQVAIDLEKSILARLDGHIQGSQRIVGGYRIENFRYTIDDVHQRALTTLMFISYLENLLQLEEYQSALEASSKVLVENDPCLYPMGRPNHRSPEIQLRVSLRWVLICSKIEHANGHPQKALLSLLQGRALLEEPGLGCDSSRYQIICSLCDLLCASRCERCLCDAEETLQAEINRTADNSEKPSEAMWWLKVSLYEIYLVQQRYSEISMDPEILQALRGSLAKPGITSQWLYLRSLSVAARVSFHRGFLDDCLHEWSEFLDVVKGHNIECQSMGYLLWVADISLFLATQSKATASERLGAPTWIDRNPSLGTPHFFITLITSGWLPYVQGQIKFLQHGIGSEMVFPKVPLPHCPYAGNHGTG